MEIMIGMCFILLVCSAQGLESSASQVIDRCNDICEKSNTMITCVRKMDRSLFYTEKSLIMEFDRDTTISPNAFSLLKPTLVRFTMPSTTERNKSALHTLTLYPDSFVGLSNAHSIFVMYANINLCGRNMTSIINLKWFRFIDCGFTEVPTEMLESTPKLEELSFRSNYIRIIRPNAFGPVKSLIRLHLEDNGIISLEPDCFKGLDNLEILGVSGNNFTVVPSIFNGLTKLRQLHIENVYDGTGFNLDILQNITAVIDLRMGNNNITSLKPHMFDIVPHLEFLSLSKNQITSIPKGVFNTLGSLKEVRLAHNHIKTIEPGAFSGLNLSLLYLSYNGVDKIIETYAFSNLTTKYLHLRSNNITELKARAFDGLSTQYLDLTKNKLKQIGAEDFLGLETDELDLSDNKIETIAPNAFKNTTVKLLRLARNLIDMEGRRNWGLPQSTKISMELLYEN